MNTPALFSLLMTFLYIVLFYIVFWMCFDVFMFWRHESYKEGQKWLLLEIKVSRENLRGPKAMEQVLRGVFNLRNYQNGPRETYLDGEIPRWISFEICGEKNQMRMFVRIFRSFRHPFTATFYAHYPDIELIEVEEDYLDHYPATYHELQKRKLDIYVVVSLELADNCLAKRFNAVTGRVAIGQTLVDCVLGSLADIGGCVKGRDPLS